MRGLLRIAALVNPIIPFEPVLLASIGHELPNASCSDARNRIRQERALGLRKVHQILWNSLFVEDTAHHCIILPFTLEPVLHNGTPSWRSEKAEEIGRASCRERG